MLTSIAVILLLGLLIGCLFSKLKLPSLLGMIIVGIVLSPHVLNLIDESILGISGELRQIALVIILTRAGLSLDVSDLKKVGRPAILMCFVPACVEILGTMILAGASVDDVFVIVVFAAFTALASTGEISLTSFIQIPISIVLGIILGSFVGIVLVAFFKMCHMRVSIKILIILSISFLLLEVENTLKGYIPVSGLLAIMSMGIFIKQKYDVLALRLSAKYNKLWLGAEVILFVLVGATVDLKYVSSAGVSAVLLVIGALLFRMTGVTISLLKTGLSRKEKRFCMVAYIPKATVQAAIGAIPLSMGLECGNIVLTVAVLSILITAPFGAICIDNLHKRLLEKS